MFVNCCISFKKYSIPYYACQCCICCWKQNDKEICFTPCSTSLDFNLSSTNQASQQSWISSENNLDYKTFYFVNFKAC